MGRPPELEGLLITSLRDNGKARESGLAPGDRVVQFDGLTVRGLSDLEPYPGQRRAQLSVLRGDSRNPLVVEVDVAGYAPRSAQAWTIGLGLCSAIALLLLLSRGPAALALSWVLSLRARAKQLDHREVLLGRASAQRARTPGRGIVPFLIVSVVWASLSLGLVRVPADLDLLLVLGLYAGGLLVVRLVGGGLGKRGWSLFRALKSVGRGLLTVGLVLLLLVPAVVMSSSLSLVDLVERQAGYPWSFAAFSNPSAYVVFGLLLSILVLQSLGVAPREPRTAQHGTARHVLLQGLNNLELVHLLLLCGLITVLYLGGWSWPQTWGESYGRLGPALLFQTKLTLMFLATVWLRGRLPRVPEHYLQGIYWKRILPLALGAALLAPVWTVSAWPSWLQPAATWSLLTLTALGLAAVVWVQRSHKAQVPSLNPWL